MAKHYSEKELNLPPSKRKYANHMKVPDGCVDIWRVNAVPVYGSVGIDSQWFDRNKCMARADAIFAMASDKRVPYRQRKYVHVYVEHKAAIKIGVKWHIVNIPSFTVEDDESSATSQDFLVPHKEDPLHKLWIEEYSREDDPAENIFYADKKKMREGDYKLFVVNYSRRATGPDDKGFTAEIEFEGQTLSFSYDKVIRTHDSVDVATIKYSRASGFEIVKSMPSSTSAKTVWGIQTQTFHKVSMMMLSPNHWDAEREGDFEVKVGNKHYIFILEGATNDGTARGFFNEFLAPELKEHRKVLEMVGGKMTVADSKDQLSGLGFSSTKKESLIVKVGGTFSRTLKIVF